MNKQGGSNREKQEALRRQLLLYAVTDRRWLAPGERLTEVTERLIVSGVTCVQLREKKLDDAALLSEARAMLDVCRRCGVPLIINDRPDIAKQAGADGVHVGQSDGTVAEARKILGAQAIIGATAHSVSEALSAEAAGADYLGCGAVFGTATKQDTTALSIEELRRICRTVHIPVAAIGGIDAQNLRQLRGTGIAGAAVIHALYGAERKEEAAAELRRAAEQAVRGDGAV